MHFREGWSLVVLAQISSLLDEQAKPASSEEGMKTDAVTPLRSIGTEGDWDESWRVGRNFFYLNLDRVLKEGIRLLNRDSEPVAHTCDSPAAAPKVVHWTRKARSFLELDVDPEGLLQSLKISLSLMTAVFLGVLYRKDYGYWSTITVTLGLVTVLAGKNVVKILLALIPWLVMTSFMRESKLLKLAGASSAFVSAVIIVAKKHIDPVPDFTLVRVTLAIVGLSTFLIVEALICPRRAAVLAHEELALNLKQLRECLDRSFRLHATTARCRKCLVTEAEDNVKRLKVGIERLKSLVAEAAAEPEFWSSPFPADIYSRLAEGLENMADNFQLMTSFSPRAQHSPASCLTEPAKAVESQLVAAVDGLWRLQPQALRKREVKDMEKQNRAKPAAPPLSYGTSRDQIRKLDAAAKEGELTGTKLSSTALAFCCQELVRETMDLQKSMLHLDQDVP